MHRIKGTIVAAAVIAATPGIAQEITLYSGRGETLVAPIIAAFEAETGITVNVRYGGTTELAILLQEEGDASPADVFWAQDAAALGAVVDLFAPLPDALLEQVPPAYRDTTGRWIATSGRGRVLVYAPDRVDEAELPATMAELTDERFRGRIAVPPTNGSFLAHLTALRVAEGEEAARDWIAGIAANDPVIVSNNTAAHQAILDGEADFSLTNNYYLGRFQDADPDVGLAHHVFADGDIGNLLLVAGMGILASSERTDAAEALIAFMLSETGQDFFVNEGYEYPVTDAVTPLPGRPTLEEVQVLAPDVDLNTIGDLEGTLELLRAAGLV